MDHTVPKTIEAELNCNPKGEVGGWEDGEEVATYRVAALEIQDNYVILLHLYYVVFWWLLFLQASTTLTSINKYMFHNLSDRIRQPLFDIK